MEPYDLNPPEARGFAGWADSQELLPVRSGRRPADGDFLGGRIHNQVFHFYLQVRKSGQIFIQAVGECAFILNLVVTDLSSQVLRNIPPRSLDPVYILFGLVAFPLFAIAFYFALAFVAGILDQELSPSLRIAYILLWAILFAVFLARIQVALAERSLPPIVRILNLFSGLVMVIIPVAIYVYLLLQAPRRSGD